METPAKTNTPYSIEYQIIIEEVNVFSNSEKNDILESVVFYIKSCYNNIEFNGSKIEYHFDVSDLSNFKEFSEFTKEEIINILQANCFDQILTEKTRLNSLYYINKKTITQENIPWN